MSIEGAPRAKEIGALLTRRTITIGEGSPPLRVTALCRKKRHALLHPPPHPPPEPRHSRPRGARRGRRPDAQLVRLHMAGPQEPAPRSARAELVLGLPEVR